VKQENDLSPLPFNCVLQYAIRKVEENREGLKMNGAHHLLVYTNDNSMLGENTAIIRKSTEALLQANREVSLEVNAERTKCMVISRHQNER
jgi:hypothetical protein